MARMYRPHVQLTRIQAAQLFWGPLPSLPTGLKTERKGEVGRNGINAENIIAIEAFTLVVGERLEALNRIGHEPMSIVKPSISEAQYALAIPGSGQQRLFIRLLRSCTCVLIVGEGYTRVRIAIETCESKEHPAVQPLLLHIVGNVFERPFQQRDC